MKALSIRQPWAWLIANGHKDIENRCWKTFFRGRFLIHASKGMTQDASPWFFGEYGFVIKDARPLPFAPCKGSLQFFTPAATSSTAH